VGSSKKRGGSQTRLSEAKWYNLSPTEAGGKKALTPSVMGGRGKKIGVLPLTATTATVNTKTRREGKRTAAKNPRLRQKQTERKGGLTVPES